MPKTIFFDVGNTLLFPNRERIHAPLRSKGVLPSAEQLAALERRTNKEFDRLLESTAHAGHGFWYTFYTHLLEELGVQDDGLRDNLVEATRLSVTWDSSRPGTCEALRQ